jgi:hypothetical protein
MIKPLALIAILLVFTLGATALYRVDTNHDSFMSPDEFYAYFRKNHPSLSEDLIRSIVTDIFNNRDLDRDGLISLPEKNLFQTPSPGTSAPAQPATNPNQSDVPQTGQSSHNPDQHHKKHPSLYFDEVPLKPSGNIVNTGPIVGLYDDTTTSEFDIEPPHLRRSSTRPVQTQAINLNQDVSPTFAPRPFVALPPETVAFAADKPIREAAQTDENLTGSPENDSKDYISEKYPMHPINASNNDKRATPNLDSQPSRTACTMASVDEPSDDNEEHKVTPIVSCSNLEASHLSNRFKSLSALIHGHSHPDSFRCAHHYTPGHNRYCNFHPHPRRDGQTGGGGIVVQTHNGASVDDVA